MIDVLFRTKKPAWMFHDGAMRDGGQASVRTEWKYFMNHFKVLHNYPPYPRRMPNSRVSLNMNQAFLPAAKRHGHVELFCCCSSCSWQDVWLKRGNLCFLDHALHFELRSVVCNGAEENQTHCCDPYGLRVQEQPLFLVCSSIMYYFQSYRSSPIEVKIVMLEQIKNIGCS